MFPSEVTLLCFVVGGEAKTLSSVSPASRVQLVIGGIRVCRLTFAMAHFYHPLR
jgi:hypothetical protein